MANARGRRGQACTVAAHEQIETVHSPALAIGESCACVSQVSQGAVQSAITLVAGVWPHGPPPSQGQGRRTRPTGAPINGEMTW